MKLIYDVGVVGTANVDRALASMERKAAASNRRTARMLGVTPAGAAGGGGSDSSKAMKLARLEQGVQRFQHNQALRNIKEQQRAKIQAERAVAKEAAAGQRAKMREEQVATRTRLSNEKAAQRDQLRQTRVAARHTQTARVARERFTRGAVGRVTDSVGGTARSIAGGATAVLGLGGGMIAADSVRKSANLEREAAQLANMAVGVDGETRSRQEIAKGLTSQVRAEAVRTGLGSEGVLQAIREYHGKSGLMKNAQQILPYMTDVSQAYGADITDVGRTGGSISQSLMVNHGIDGAENVQKTKDIIGAMAGQAKIGSIEFADLATVMTSLMASTTRFEGDIVDLAKTMGAIGQMAAAGGADSPEESMTAIKRLSDDMIKYGNTTFKDNGIDVYNRDKDGVRTTLKDPAVVLFEVMKKTGGDLVKAQSMFKLRADKGFAPFQSMFTKAGGGEAGFKAMMDMLDRFKDAAVSEEEVKTAATAVRSTAAGQYEIAMAKLQDSLGTRLLPALVKLIPEFEKLIPSLSKAAVYFARFVAELASNPAGTILKVIAAKLALDLASAGIGKALTAGVVGIVNRAAAAINSRWPGATGGGSGGVVTGGATGAPKTKFLGKPGMGAVGGSALGAAGAGLTIATMIMTAGVVNLEAGETNMANAGSRLNDAREAAKRGDVETVNRLFKEGQDELMKAQAPTVTESLFGKTADSWVNPNKEVEINTMSSFLEELRGLNKVAAEAKSKADAEAAAALKEAAVDQKAAAQATKDALAGYLPNRGNSPAKPN